MLLPLICALATAKQDITDSNKPYLPQLFPKQNGKNGYEEYLAADDLLKKIGRYDWSSARKLKGAEKLKVERANVAKFGKAILLVVKGNSKIVRDPRKRIDEMTLFPEFADFKSLARLMVEEADVEFHDGHAMQATETLAQVLTFGQKVSYDPTLIGYLVGAAIQAIGMKGIQPHQNELTATGARRLEGLTEPGIDDVRKAVEYSIRSDFRRTETIVFDLIAGRIPSGIKHDSSIKDFRQAVTLIWQLSSANEDGTPVPNPSAAHMADQIEKLTPSEQRQHLKAAHASKAAFLEWLHRTLASPESNWNGSRIPRSEDSIVAKLNEEVLPIFDFMMENPAGLRTTYRILRLTVLVVEYKAKRGHLPSTLASMHSGTSILDPLSGKEFVYEKSAHGFVVRSLGSKTFGPVTLAGRKAPKR